MELTNSKRLLYTASYVVTKLTADEQHQIEQQPGGGLQKANLLRALSLNAEDVSRLQQQVQREHPDMQRPLEKLLKTAGDLASARHQISQMQLASTLSHVPNSAVARFAELARPEKVSDALHVIREGFNRQRQIAPAGRLNLERIEIYPVGEERGEMVFTVPLAPAESVTISHKEWSTSSQEYEEFVQDSFESYSERGVSEKTDASMSSENEARHANTLNFGSTLSGGFGGAVSLTTTLGLTKTDEERESVRQSMEQNREVTEKASARARQEHKISMKLETKAGVEDSSFRTITNPNDNKAMRIDYYRLMRKWRTDLFRYGVRMTYDITIPTPGIRLFAHYKYIADLDAQLRVPFPFGLKWTDLSDLNWQEESIKVSATVAPPPDPQLFQTVSQDIPFITADDSKIMLYGKVEFDVPPGYTLQKASFVADVKPWDGHPQVVFHVLNSELAYSEAAGGSKPFTVKSSLPQLLEKSGHLTVSYQYSNISNASISIDLTFQRTDANFANWQLATWTAIRAAAEARYNEAQARVQAERDRLWLELSGKDTLSLRRLEREELLRCIMLWLVGPSFPVSTPEVAACIDQILSNELGFLKGDTLMEEVSPTMDFVTDNMSLNALAFGEFVKFVHEAVEWENLLYFLYPYFWGDEKIGRDKLLFEHQDQEHRNFLRAGYARVVITIRPGYEADFMRLVETGSPSGTYQSPYMPIAEEIEAFARTNYAGIPPANPEKHVRPLLYPQQRESWTTMQKVIDLLENEKTTNGSYPPDLSSLPGAPFKDAWGRDLIYNLPGSGNDYDLFCYGADGVPGGEDLNADISAAAGASLVASWFDYTPTSGLDIDIKAVSVP